MGKKRGKNKNSNLYITNVYIDKSRFILHDELYVRFQEKKKLYSCYSFLDWFAFLRSLFIFAFPFKSFFASLEVFYIKSCCKVKGAG